MQVRLAYGRDGLKVTLPDGCDIIKPRATLGLPDEQAALVAALREPIDSPPLAELVQPGDRVVIVHTDITRATPNDRILPPVLAELEGAGIRREEITLLNGLGTHRPQTEAELRAMLGDSIVDNYRCLQHDCFDDASLVSLGTTQLGHPVRINRDYLAADFKILTGFIEPHFFAGFSGGPKAILPSLAGTESVFSNHSVSMVADPRATWGVIEGNPIWQEMREVALRTEPGFLLNVTLNARHEISGVFAGELLAAHAAGCDFVRASAMIPVSQPYDIVITTNSGYPLDQNLYQSVKGMRAAAEIVREGGSIIVAAACEDGVPDHGQYASLLAQVDSPQQALDLISQPGFLEHDQWQVQIQAHIQLKADVYVYSQGLTDDQIENALFLSCHDIEETVDALHQRYGPNARIAVLPEGPQTVPYLEDNSSDHRI
ncbi:MAG: nickel-dependent lactate racemase [Chloroflexota bacterium]|nr:nickel-dependent lactate racemase [Chloroflexota bacterium]